MVRRERRRAGRYFIESISSKCEIDKIDCQLKLFISRMDSLA